MDETIEQPIDMVDAVQHEEARCENHGETDMEGTSTEDVSSVARKSKSATPIVEDASKRVVEESSSVEISESVEQTLETTTSIETVSVEAATTGSAAMGLVFDYKRMPKVITQPLTSWLRAGEGFKIQVEVVQRPETQVTWYHNDEPLNLAGLLLR